MGKGGGRGRAGIDVGGRVGTGGGGIVLALLGVADKRAFLRGGWSCINEIAAR